MMKWLDFTNKRNQNDPDIIWKASSMHHPMFGMFYQDYEAIIADFLPRMQRNSQDVYFNGHEHLLNYANIPAQVDVNQFTTPAAEQRSKIADDDHFYGCQDKSTWYPRGGAEAATRKAEFFKGEKFHQFTIGASGRPHYDLCQSGLDDTKGEFSFADSKHHGFALVTVTPQEFNVKIKGFEYIHHRDKNLLRKAIDFFSDGTYKPKDLFEVTIKRQAD